LPINVLHEERFGQIRKKGKKCVDGMTQKNLASWGGNLGRTWGERSNFMIVEKKNI